MNNKHKKTLAALYATPPPKDMMWADLQSLFVALGATITEGDGSRVKFDMNGVTVAFHRPHNPSTLRAYQVKLARVFLQSMEKKP